MKIRAEGFTLVEIMIVIMIVGLLATLSIPSYQKSRESAQKSVCINNLRLLQDAGDQYLFDHPGITTTNVSNLAEFMRTGEVPSCPVGGGYTMMFDTESIAVCSYGNEHEL